MNIYDFLHESIELLTIHAVQQNEINRGYQSTILDDIGTSTVEG